jgi:hypothetical protein
MYNTRLGPNKKNNSFGRFFNFPSIIHGTTSISHKTSIIKLQQIIVETLFSINKVKLVRSLSVAGQSGVYTGEVGFEIGIADGLYFDYLDNRTRAKLVQYLKFGTTISVLDVLIIVSYHYSKGKKRISLNFDHNLLRFIFRNQELRLYLHHSRGIRRIPLDEFLNYIIQKINEQMKKNRLKTFKVEHLKTL